MSAAAFLTRKQVAERLGTVSPRRVDEYAARFPLLSTARVLDPRLGRKVRYRADVVEQHIASELGAPADETPREYAARIARERAAARRGEQQKVA